MNAYSYAYELHLTQCEQLLNQVTVILQTVEDNNENIRQFDTGADVVKYLNEQGIPEAEHYKYIFTCINGEGTKLYLLNGWHFCDRLYYLVSTIGWSTGDKEADGNISIEVNY